MSRERSSHRSGAHRIATTLGPDARALLEAARGGDDPSPSDRARMRHALMSAIAGATVTTAAASASAASVLGSGGLSAGSTGAASAGAASISGAASAGAASIAGATTAVGATSISGLLGVPLAMKAAVLVIAASATGVLALGVSNVARPTREVASVPAISAPLRTSTPAIAEAAPPIDVSAIEPSAPVLPAPAALAPATPDLELTSPRHAPARPRDPAARRSAPAIDTAIAVPAPAVSTLADEMALIRAAWADLRAGRGEDALASLDAHQSRFPEGALAPERDAARAIALCASTRRDEGLRAASSFLRAHPRSPLAARVRDACR